MNKKIYISNLIRTLIVFSCIICVTSCASQGVTSAISDNIQSPEEGQSGEEKQDQSTDAAGTFFVDITFEGG